MATFPRTGHVRATSGLPPTCDIPGSMRRCNTGAGRLKTITGLGGGFCGWPGNGGPFHPVARRRRQVGAARPSTLREACGLTTDSACLADLGNRHFRAVPYGPSTPMIPYYLWPRLRSGPFLSFGPTLSQLSVQSGRACGHPPPAHRCAARRYRPEAQPGAHQVRGRWTTPQTEISSYKTKNSGVDY